MDIDLNYLRRLVSSEGDVSKEIKWCQFMEGLEMLSFGEKSDVRKSQIEEN